MWQINQQSLASEGACKPFARVYLRDFMSRSGKRSARIAVQCRNSWENFLVSGSAARRIRLLLDPHFSRNSNNSYQLGSLVILFRLKIIEHVFSEFHFWVYKIPLKINCKGQIHDEHKVQLVVPLFPQIIYLHFLLFAHFHWPVL